MNELESLKIEIEKQKAEIKFLNNKIEKMKKTFEKEKKALIKTFQIDNEKNENYKVKYQAVQNKFRQQQGQLWTNRKRDLEIKNKMKERIAELKIRIVELSPDDEILQDIDFIEGDKY
jgi:spore coat polysaccharide biosynthesis protein SpsF (cytidylyltransferase family)